MKCNFLWNHDGLRALVLNVNQPSKTNNNTIDYQKVKKRKEHTNLKQPTSLIYDTSLMLNKKNIMKLLWTGGEMYLRASLIVWIWVKHADPKSKM